MPPTLRNWFFLLVLLPTVLPAAQLGPVCAGPALRPAGTTALGTTGQLRALVIFARFADETGSALAPAYAQDLFNPDLPGSLTHFFDEMSSGQFHLTGDVLSHVVTAPGPADRYLTNSSSGLGGFGQFTMDILDRADGDVDFSLFDNDGPDGRPNSGDDDGAVDLLFLVTQSAPSGFIVGEADGVAQLGLPSDYDTEDASASGGRIRIRGDEANTVGGTLQRGLNFADAVGIMAHELGHVFGLPDLYDRDRTRGQLVELDDDSAGIGFWGLMGHGARGFDDRGGPTPLSAWSRQELGWIGPGNDRLLTVTETIQDALLTDAHDDGIVYRVPLAAESQYLLVEHRSATGSHYDRHLPADGVLIWHVRSNRQDNDNEDAKLVDLVCADGLYLDAGFPLGQQSAPYTGRDNLDFFSRDAGYAAEHGGNLGDATDVYDGVRFTEFAPLSNPATNGGVSISDIRRAGSGFSADLVVDDRRRAGIITANQTWRDTIDVVGDVTIAVGASVTLSRSVVVRMHQDGRATGADPERVELFVQGRLSSSSSASIESAASPPRPGDWIGVSTTSSGSLSLGNTTIRHARDALTVRGGSLGLLLNGTSVREASRHGIRLLSVAGDVRLQGVTVADVGGDGITIDGGDPVRADDIDVRANAGHGLARADGRLTLTDSRLQDNGTFDLWLQEGSFGQVTGNQFSGSGEGTRVDLTGALTIEQNGWSGYGVALRTRSAGPMILSNTFSEVDTVLIVQGFRVPTQVQLNVVHGPRMLIVNETGSLLDASRNFWGTSEPEVIAAAMSGDVAWEPALNIDPRLPVEFALEQNAPNPFNSSTTIRFSVSQLDISLTAGQPMRLRVHNVTGGLVRTLIEQEAAPGVFEAAWDGRDETGRRAASGVYYYELSVGPLRLLQKMALLR